MKQRQQHQRALAAWLQVRHAILDLRDIGGEIGVAQHGALGHAGRAAGILQNREIDHRIDRDRRYRAAIGKEALEADVPRLTRNPGEFLCFEQAEKQPLQRRQRRAQRADDDFLEAARLRHGGDLWIDLFDIERHHDLRAGILDLPGDFARRH